MLYVSSYLLPEMNFDNKFSNSVPNNVSSRQREDTDGKDDTTPCSEAVGQHADGNQSDSLGGVGDSEYDGAPCTSTAKSVSEEESSDSSCDRFFFRGVGVLAHKQDASVGGTGEPLSALDLGVGKFHFGHACFYSSSSSEDDDDTWTSPPREVSLDRDRDAEVAARSDAEVTAIRDAINANDQAVRAFDPIEIILKAKLEQVRKVLKSGTIRNTIDQSLGCPPPTDETFAESEDIIYQQIAYYADDDRPPPNQECLEKKARNHLEFSSVPKSFLKWSNSDKAKLRRVVDLVRARQLGVKKATRSANCGTKVKEEPEEVFLDEKDYDWGLIAHWFHYKHSATECRAMWLNHVLPTTRGRVRTSAAERKNLRALAQSHGEQDWDAIAAELGTGRSALQCFVMYQSELGVAAGQTWSPEEEEELERLVEDNSTGNVINWSNIAFHMPSRDLKQIYNKWQLCANPSIRKGKFTDAEDVLVVKGIRMHGLKFSKIAKEFLPWRTGAQVRSHHARTTRNHHVGCWTREEDTAILNLVDAYGNSWQAVSDHFVSPCRTRTQVRNRYMILQRWMASNGTAKRQPTRQLVAWLRQRERLKSLTEYANSKIRFARNVGRRTLDKRHLKIDEAIDTFVTANFVEGRNGRRPGSLRKAFELGDAEAGVRATETRQILSMLGARLNMKEEAVRRDISISNHDKAVLLRMLGGREEQSVVPSTSGRSERGGGGDAPAERSEPSEEASTARLGLPSRPGTSSASPGEPVCGARTNGRSSPARGSPRDDANVEAHSDFLLPHIDTLDGLLNMLLNPYMDVEKRNRVGKKKKETNSENVKKAEDLWMERLKTIYLYSILVPAGDQLDPGESSSGDEDEERNVSCEAVAEVEAEAEAAIKKRAGRPRKKRRGKTKVNEDDPPKRKYKKTGKYSKMKGLGRRTSQRNRSTVAEPSDVEPTQEV